MSRLVGRRGGGRKGEVFLSVGRRFPEPFPLDHPFQRAGRGTLALDDTLMTWRGCSPLRARCTLVGGWRGGGRAPHACIREHVWHTNFERT